VTTSSALIRWSAAVGASYYLVAVDDDVIGRVDGNVTSLTVSQLQAGTRYTITVTVCDSHHQQGNTVRAVFMTGNEFRFYRIMSTRWRC